jgi:hypothetical protein
MTDTLSTRLPGSPDADNNDIGYDVLRPLYGNPSSPRALHKTMDAFFKSEGFDTIGFEESVCKRAGGGKYVEDIYVSAHVDDCLFACKSKDIMAAFKKEILTRFVGTDEGEVTEYLGCEVIRDRSAKTAKIVQKGYAERVLKTFGMWDCKPSATPLDANSKLSKADCPQVEDPALHRRYRCSYWMLVVFCEHDEARSRVCIFSVTSEQVCTISRSGTSSGC